MTQIDPNPQIYEDDALVAYSSICAIIYCVQYQLSVFHLILFPTHVLFLIMVSGGRTGSRRMKAI